MPRRARIVLVGVPHHVTQRGNRRERVFFSDGDRIAYLSLLRKHAEHYALEVVAYCLMPNHVHFVVVPADEGQLSCAIGATHGQYAQRMNRMRNQSGHFWQGRFFSSALDSGYFINAVRYVELNPVRAGLAAKAEDFWWSSAPTHCGLRGDPIVAARPRSEILAGIASWSRWLAEGIPEESLETLRRNASQGLPCGSADFIERLERETGRSLRYTPAGRERDQEKK